MSKTKNKLSLARETIAPLGADDLAGVAGGNACHLPNCTVDHSRPPGTSLTVPRPYPIPPMPTIGGPTVSVGWPQPSRISGQSRAL